MAENIWHQVLAALGDYWLEAVVSIGFILLGWFLGFWRARQQWKARSFLERINISLNMVHDGKLLIRTLAERPIEEVFINPAAISKIQRAIKKTTEDNPIPPLAREDFWPILNRILNVISEHFGAGYIRKDLGYPVKTEEYLFCLTYERASEMRTSKIRAMLFKKSLLLNLPEEEPEYEQPSHRIRFRTLKQLAVIYRKTPQSFLEVELSL